MLKSVRAKLFLTICILVVITLGVVMIANAVYIQTTDSSISDLSDYARFLGIVGVITVVIGGFTVSIITDIFTKPIVIELTPHEEKVLTEVHDFLFQEIKFPELHDFFFREINLFGKKNK